MLKRLLYFLILLVVTNINSLAQDPTFSQFYANPLYLAPSFAGATDNYRFSLNYRNEWPGISNIYNTYSFSFDKSFDSFNSGIGIIATHDVAGAGNLSTTNIGFLYSYDFNINERWHIRPGVNFKFRYLGLDISKLIFINQLIGTTPSPYQPPFDNVADIDFATSVLVYSDNIWGGFTFDHLLRPDESFYNYDAKMPIKFNAFGGIQFLKKTRLITKKYDNFSLAFNFQLQGKSYQTDIGLYYNTNIFIFGLWYRGIPLVTSEPGDAIIGLIGIKTKQLHIGYSYDFTISSLNYATAGSHEISLVYEFDPIKINSKRKMKALPCPEF